MKIETLMRLQMDEFVDAVNAMSTLKLPHLYAAASPMAVELAWKVAYIASVLRTDPDPLPPYQAMPRRHRDHSQEAHRVYTGVRALLGHAYPESGSPLEQLEKLQIPQT